MSADPQTWVCATCGETHRGFPLSWAAEYPDSYAALGKDARKDRAVIGTDQCVIDDREFFVRGCIEIPVVGLLDPFVWGAWVLLWKRDYEAISEMWETQGRESLQGPFPGRLNNRFVVYPDTLNLKVKLHVSPVGVRPNIVVEEPDHPLAVEQKEGMTLSRVAEIAARLMHS